jgi:hypothetical protein
MPLVPADPEEKARLSTENQIILVIIHFLLRTNSSNTYRFWLTSQELRVMIYELQVMGYGLQVKGY